MPFKGSRRLISTKMAIIEPSAYTYDPVGPGPSVGATGSLWGQPCLPHVKMCWASPQNIQSQLCSLIPTTTL